MFLPVDLPVFLPLFLPVHVSVDLPVFLHMDLFVYLLALLHQYFTHIIQGTGMPAYRAVVNASVECPMENMGKWTKAPAILIVLATKASSVEEPGPIMSMTLTIIVREFPTTFVYLPIYDWRVSSRTAILEENEILAPGKPA